MKKNSWIILFFGMLLLGMLYWMKHSTPVESSAPTDSSTPAPKNDSATAALKVPETNPARSETPTPPSEATNDALGDLKAPTLEMAETESSDSVESNELTPLSYENFSNELAPHMSRALQDEQYAEQVAKFLNDCATNTEKHIASSVRAYCLINYKRLGDRHPKLRDDFDKAKTSAPAKAQSVFGAMDNS